MLGDRGLKCILEKYMCQLDWVQWCAVVSLVMNSQVLYKLGAFVLLTKCYLSDQIKNQMGWVCCTYEGAKRCIQSFGGKT
jgi:hypothetical protein